VSAGANARALPPGEAEALHRSLQAAKLKPPPKDCLSPIGAEALLAGMLKGVRAEFYTASVRPPAVYRGYPFQVEAALAWGGDVAKGEDEPQARVIRFANRVPLLHQPGSCCIHRAVQDVHWGNYGLPQAKGSLPRGPLVVLVHLASVWVPYTSEGKESIADYDEIRREIRLALTECGRRLGALIRRKRTRAGQRERRGAFSRYIGEVVDAVSAMTPTDAEALRGSLEEIARSHTARADEEYDDHGKVAKAMPDTILVDLDRAPPRGYNPEQPPAGPTAEGEPSWER
jgi:DNA topoisomerase-6 subunit B